MKLLISMLVTIISLSVAADNMATGSANVNAEGLSYSQVKSLFNKGQPVSMADFATADEIKKGVKPYQIRFFIGRLNGAEVKKSASSANSPCIVKAVRNYFEYIPGGAPKDINIVFQQEELVGRQSCQADYMDFTLRNFHAQLDYGKSYFKYDVSNGSLRATIYDQDKSYFGLGKRLRVEEYRKIQGLLISRFLDLTPQEDPEYPDVKNFYVVHSK